MVNRIADELDIPGVGGTDRPMERPGSSALDDGMPFDEQKPPLGVETTFRMANDVC